MAFKKIPLTIDTMIRNPVPVEGINQEDNIELNIVVTENKTPKDLSSQTIKVYVRRIDGTLVEQTDQITPTNARKGEVTVKLKNSAFNKEGYALFQLDVSDSIGRITSSYATFKVGKGLVSGEAIANTNEIEALKKVEEYIKKANQELETFKQTVTEINENEALRNEAEKLRVATETGRVEAESLRVTAEEERAAAETKREEGFNKFDGKINANTKELKAARSATTGEKFNTLDERIDHEVDRLNKKIDVTMLQQEDKENHTIENTVDGMTTDMIVKGRTLQNLFNQEGYYINPNGSQQYFHSRKYKNLFKTGKYTLKNITGNALIWDISRKDNDEWIKSIKSNKSIVIELEEGQYVRNIQALTINGWVLDESTRKILENNVVVLEGDKLDIIDSINYFEGIKSFGQQEGKISILSSGKNFFKSYKSKSKGNTSIFNIENDNVTIGTNQSPSWTNATINYGKLKIGSKYTVSCESFTGGVGDKVLFAVKKYRGRNEVGAYGDITKSSLSLTFTVVDDADIVLRFFVNNTTPINTPTSITYNNIQIIEGVKTDYAPSVIDKKDILLSEYGFDEGLRGLNDTVYDKLNDIENVAIKRIGKHAFTGNETIRQLENSTKALIVLVENINGVDSKHFISNSNIGYETRWNVIEWENNYPIAFNFKDSSAGSMSLLISKSKIPSVTDIDSLKQYLRENNIELYYQLKEPIETPLIENINVKSFNEKNYVSFENAISGTSSFKAPVDTKATIARLNRENRALEEENKTLRQDFESTTLSLTDSDLELVKQNVDMDFRLMEVEFALDIPQSTLSSNIKFKKKGEVKSMARTPYEMMKIVILSGDYDREDYIHKVGKYYERGRMTKEEYDELMSLMTADEVIGG